MLLDWLQTRLMEAGMKKKRLPDAADTASRGNPKGLAGDS